MPWPCGGGGRAEAAPPSPRRPRRRLGADWKGRAAPRSADGPHVSPHRRAGVNVSPGAENSPCQARPQRPAIVDDYVKSLLEIQKRKAGSQSLLVPAAGRGLGQGQEEGRRAGHLSARVWGRGPARPRGGRGGRAFRPPPSPALSGARSGPSRALLRPLLPGPGGLVPWALAASLHLQGCLQGRLRVHAAGTASARPRRPPGPAPTPSAPRQGSCLSRCGLTALGGSSPPFRQGEALAPAAG